MSRLPITVATWDYDRVRALTDGRVQIEGCDVNYLTMPVEECFERAFFHGEFEVAEIGFSPFLIALSRGPTPYVAVPVFLSRMFRHSAVYIRADRGIEGPADLRGKTIGVPEYQMSAVMWIRGHLKDAFGIGYCNITKCCTEVCPEDIHITDNAIIPLKERVVDQFYDPLTRLFRILRPSSREAQ